MTTETQSSAPALKVRSKRHLYVTVGISLAFLGIIGTFFWALGINPNRSPSVQEGKEAKSFSVKWLQGQDLIASPNQPTLSLAGLRGKPVILNFWASWCVSCREEARDFEKFWENRTNQDIQVVGIAIQDTEDKAREFARYFGKTYALGIDEDGKAGLDYGITGVPETFLIDRDGKILHKEAAPVSFQMLKEFEARLK
jgi:cytochrome c biogenesis protein CcmG/thiol:disulfide interchange protein DsbE